MTRGNETMTIRHSTILLIMMNQKAWEKLTVYYYYLLTILTIKGETSLSCSKTWYENG